MKGAYNILIIDDHPIIAEGYSNVIKLHNWGNSNRELKMEIKSVFTIDSAINVIKNYSETKPLDLVILDINLPSSETYKFKSGEDLGSHIRIQYKETDILVITFHTDVLKISRILRLLNPEGFLTKNDTTSAVLIKAITNIIEGKSFYSQTILEYFTKKSLQNVALDRIDLQIIKELTNGSKLKELVELVPLTKSAIEKRKRHLKKKFCLDKGSDRDLVLEARKRGFI